MIEEIIEKLSIKPELTEPPQKQFEVKYITNREGEVPFEEYKEFNMELFKGKLISKHLELVSSSASEEEVMEEPIQEEPKEKEIKEKTLEKPKAIEKPIQIASLSKNLWKVNGEDISNQLPPPIEYNIPVSPFFMNNREMFVHLDINPNEFHASSNVVAQAIGYIRGTCNVTPSVKPYAWAASTAADRFRSLKIANV